MWRLETQILAHGVLAAVALTGAARMSFSQVISLWRNDERFVAAWVAQLAAIPFFGALSDRLGRRPVYAGGAVFLLLLVFPFFWLVETRSPGLVWLAIALGMIGHAAMYGPQAAFFSELFGTRTRYTGASLGYQLAAPFSGGIAPLIASALLNWSGNQTWPVAIYLIAMAAITIACVLITRETHGRDLNSPAH